MLVVDRHEMRCWLLGQRVHHGALGVLFAALGIALAVHDRRDHRDWFRRGPGLTGEGAAAVKSVNP